MTDVAGKLWGFCNVLRHDGIDYGDYIEQLTYLLFIKMADERGIQLPTYEEVNTVSREVEHVSCDWPYLRKQSGIQLAKHYTKILARLGEVPGILGDIFGGAQNRFGNPVNLHSLIGLIDETEWTSLDVDVKAAAFEGLLERAAAEGKKGAGQYFTPRVLIRSMVRCIKPDPRVSSDFTIDDPACGTGGFLVAAYEWLKAETAGALDRDLARRVRTHTYYGQELVARPRRLALMNLYLHQVEPHITLGDSIYDTPGSRRYNVVLTNPPFGTRGANQAPARDDFVVATSNKQLNLIQHVVTVLKRGGRAAIVVPDNVLFANQAADVFKILMEDCDVHTVLRCPRGSFSPYTEGTKTNVIFFTKGRPTETVWIYDARANIPKVTKRSRPLSPLHFDEFERCYGNDPNGRSTRSESDSPEGRWRAYTIDEVRQRRYKLDSFRWIRDLESNDPEDLPEPEEAIAAALGTLQQATSNLADIQRLIDQMSAPSPDSGVEELITRMLERQDLRRGGSGPALSDAIRAIDKFRQSILGAACSGRLTTDWRDQHDDDAAALLRALKQQSRKRRKPLAMPQMDIEVEIPETWTVVTLDLLIDCIEAGKSFNALGRPATADEWGVIKVSAMSWGNFREDENKAVPEGWEINPHYEICPQDLLLSRANTEDLVGATILVGATRPKLLLSDKSLRLIPYEGVDRAWLNYTLRSPLVRRQFSELATGTSDSMRNLSQDKARSVTLFLPPTNEQIEIGRRVSALLSVADSLVAREGR